MPAHIELPRETIISFCKKWKIVQLELFGSVLREDFRSGSDVDFLLTFDPGNHWTLFDLAAMEQEMSGIVGRPVDLAIRETVEESYNWIRKKAILDSAELYYAA